MLQVILNTSPNFKGVLVSSCLLIQSCALCNVGHEFVARGRANHQLNYSSFIIIFLKQIYANLIEKVTKYLIAASDGVELQHYY